VAKFPAAGTPELTRSAALTPVRRALFGSDAEDVRIRVLRQPPYPEFRDGGRRGRHIIGFGFASHASTDGDNEHTGSGRAASGMELPIWLFALTPDPDTSSRMAGASADRGKDKDGR
jgi:hypothetical protein